MFRAARPLLRSTRCVRSYATSTPAPSSIPTAAEAASGLTNGQSLLLSLAGATALVSAGVAAVEIRATHVHPSEALETEEHLIEHVVEDVKEVAESAKEKVEAAVSDAKEKVKDGAAAARDEIADLIAQAEAALAKYK